MRPHFLSLMAVLPLLLNHWWQWVSLYYVARINLTCSSLWTSHLTWLTPDTCFSEPILCSTHFLQISITSQAPLHTSFQEDMGRRVSRSSITFRLQSNRLSAKLLDICISNTHKAFMMRSRTGLSVLVFHRGTALISPTSRCASTTREYKIWTRSSLAFSAVLVQFVYCPAADDLFAFLDLTEHSFI